MSNEDAIAKVIHDLRTGRVVNKVDDPRLLELTLKMMKGPVVDVSKIFREILETKKTSKMYEDHECLLLPWPFAQFAWVTPFGNVYVMACTVSSKRNRVTFNIETEGDWNNKIWESEPKSDYAHSLTGQWDTAEELDWEKVDYVLFFALFCGGYSVTAHRHIPTMGPLMVFRFALDEEGQPLDINWVDVTHSSYPGFQKSVQEVQELADNMGTPAGEEFFKDLWNDNTTSLTEMRKKITHQIADNALVVLLESLTFLNCRNVEIVEPKRKRYIQRRLDRAKVNIHVLTVFPVGKTTRYLKSEDYEKGEGVPLTNVRGHFARYGPKYGRGLLFGKYEGKFWIPMYSKGSAEHGISIADYKLDPDGN